MKIGFIVLFISQPLRMMQETEPLLASFLHTNVLAHQSLAKALSHLLASKMQSRTLLGTQLMRLIFDAYQEEPVSFLCVTRSCPQCLHVLAHAFII